MWRRVARADHRDAAELQRRVVRKLVPKLVQLEHLGFGNTRLHCNRCVDANGQLAVLADFIEQLELFLVRTDRLHARDAEPVRFCDGRPQRRQLLGPGALRHQARHEVDRIVLENSRRFAGAAILHDDPRLWISRLTGDAGQLERLRVGPGEIAVFVGDEHGPVVHRVVENFSRRHVRGSQQIVVAVPAEQPRRSTVCLRRSGEARFRCRRSLWLERDSGVRAPARRS